MTARASGRARENASNHQAASICIIKDRRPQKELLESHPWLLEYTMPSGSRLFCASYLLNKHPLYVNSWLLHCAFLVIPAQNDLVISLVPTLVVLKLNFILPHRGARFLYVFLCFPREGTPGNVSLYAPWPIIWGRQELYNHWRNWHGCFAQVNIKLSLHSQAINHPVIREPFSKSSPACSSNGTELVCWLEEVGKT